MSKKKITRPFTLIIGLLLIFIALSNFLDSFNLETVFTGANLIMIIIGSVLVLFAFAKSGRF